DGLKRLEYRGYDSAGVALVKDGDIQRVRREGKLKALSDAVQKSPIDGLQGIAHTRWATHGVPNEVNAHPHTSGHNVAIVHNGIIENHDELRHELTSGGFEFASDTDTEVIAHRIRFYLNEGSNVLEAVQSTVSELRGAYALVVMVADDPDALVLARSGGPVVIGLGEEENFVASDIAALLPVTRRFQFLEDGDVALVRRCSVEIYDAAGMPVDRPVVESELTADSNDRGRYRHYMEKEIHEQGRAVAATLEDRIGDGKLLDNIMGPEAGEVMPKVECVHIVACGTSYHAGLVARYQLEELAGIPCMVDIASEYRYRRPVVPENSLFVAISQSGETADTLAALRIAKEFGYLGTLAICNVPECSLVRESDFVLMTRAGPEIGVASTKAFTTQLTALALLTVALGKARGMDANTEYVLVDQLAELPSLVEQTLVLDEDIAELSKKFSDKHHAL
ncbi:MAG: glutamine--fructose-6-phosphate transaminase (isomerizing), partial [Pseudomonadota bacterium]|nr:glutamine--fructose-6-phosphate transaminase (isomerizing) [Pseudomonadota bacterium]